MSTDYQLPALPFGGPEVTIVRWLKQPGDPLARGEPLLVAVNDRVEVVLPAPEDGSLEAVLVDGGAQTTVGAVIARFTLGQPAPVGVGAAAEQPSAEEARGEVPSSARAVEAEIPRRASPVALRIAGLSNIDITGIAGSGPGGRIVKSDVLAALTDGQQTVDGQQPTETEQHVLRADTSELRTQNSNTPSPMRRAIAAHMVRSRATSPHAMTAMEVDMGRVAEVRARHRSAFARRGLDLTYTACIALAAVEALLAHPLLNSTWSDDGIILRKRIHLGIAVALPDGLLTPVVRNAQDLSLRGMARAVGDLARRARSGALQPGETSGGTFTITNPGGGSVWFGTPVINQPQAAILGVGAVRPRPLVISEGGADRIVVRPTALLTLAYDARVCDQSHADAFLGEVKRRLERFSSGV